MKPKQQPDKNHRVRRGRTGVDTLGGKCDAGGRRGRTPAPWEEERGD